MALVNAVFDEAGAETVSLVFLCGRGARRRPEYGKDVGELPPAKALSAPGSPKNVAHFFITEAATQDSGLVLPHIVTTQ
jgi:hypothetical protein